MDHVHLPLQLIHFSFLDQSKDLRFKDFFWRISKENLNVALSSKYAEMLNEFLEIFWCLFSGINLARADSYKNLISVI